MAFAAAAVLPPSIGADLESDFALSTVEPDAFVTDFAAPMVGNAFASDFPAGTYSKDSDPEVYGRYQADDGSSGQGTHRYGSALLVLRAGFDADFALWASPREPVGYEGIAVASDFVVPRHIAETYPPPAAFESDFAAGIYQLNSDTFVLAGTPLRVPAAFSLEQMLPGTIADDRAGYFVLGASTLGGAAI